MGFVIAKRVVAAVPTVLGVSVILFVALRLLPGDPVAAILAGSPATPERRGPACAVRPGRTGVAAVLDVPHERPDG
ncbi:hypothetical protein [Promicromonospora soli]